MNKHLRKFTADTLDEAYRKVVRDFGEDARVVNTSEEPRPGLRGLLGQTRVEVTAVAPVELPDAKPRRRSLAERQYAAQSAAVGSDENFHDTVAFFKRIFAPADSDDALPAPANRRPVAPLPAFGRDSFPPVTAGTNPALRPREETTSRPEPALARLRHDVSEMREMLQVLVAENPGAGIPPAVAGHYRALVAQGVARGLAADLVGAIAKGGDAAMLRNPRISGERLKMEVMKRVATSGGIRLERGRRRIVALVGATGVGKTTNLAKLAAHYAVREHARVAFVTTDTYRVAAPEQLRVFANIINVPMKVANDGAEFAEATRAFRDCDLVFVDTAGGSQFNDEQIGELCGMFENSMPDEVILVLSANMQAEELRTVIAGFGALRPTSLLFSKLDETRHFGAILTIAAETGLPLSYFSLGQNVPDDIELASPSKLARLLVEDERSRVGSSA